MKLFKERAIASGIFVLILAISAVVVYGAVSMLMYVSPTVTAVVLLTIAFGCLVGNVYSLINWLFVQPFRKGKTK